MLRLLPSTAADIVAVRRTYRTTKDVRLRTRAQMVLLAFTGLSAPKIAAVVGVDPTTVRRQLRRYQHAGLAGLQDRPRPGRPRRLTAAYLEHALLAVRRRPRSLGLSFSLWTLARLVQYLAPHTTITVATETLRRHLRAHGMTFSQPQHKVSSPDPDYVIKKTEIDTLRATLRPQDHLYYGDEVNLSLFPTLRKMWAQRGQQVMIPTPGQEQRAYGIGAVNYYTGQTVMTTRLQKRRADVANMLRQLMTRHPTGTIYLVLDNSRTHFGADIDAVLNESHGRLVLVYLPTYSPWLNPIEMLWRSMRYAVTHCELFTSLAELEAAFLKYFAALAQETVCSIIGSKAA
jgi:putative transposase